MNRLTVSRLPSVHIAAALLGLGLVLAGCSEDRRRIVILVPVTPPSTTPQPVLSGTTLATGTQLTFTAHRGLEVVAPTTTLVGTPTGSLTISDVGFNLTLSDSTTAAFDTRGIASDIVGRNSYSICTQACTGGGPFTGIAVSTELTGGAKSSLSYSTYGIWAKEDYTNRLTTGSAAVTTGVFATGTATTTMPTTGTAVFSGGVAGAEFTGTPAGGSPTNTFTGNVSLTADFAANTITGAVTGLSAVSFSSGRYAGRMNDIALTGGTISGNAFTGTAMAAAAVAGTTLNIAGTNGQFGGKFYGAGAVEAAGSMALTGGGVTVIGAFGAKR